MNRIAIILSFLLIIRETYSQNSNLTNDQLLNYNGVYKACSNDAPELQKENFWSHLKPFKMDNLSKKDESFNFSLQVIDNKWIRITILNDTLKLTSKVLRYKVGKESIRIPKIRNQRMVGFPPIFFTSHGEELTFTLDSQNNLQIHFRGISWGMLMFLAAGNDIDINKIYTRID